MKLSTWFKIVLKTLEISSNKGLVLHFSEVTLNLAPFGARVKRKSFVLLTKVLQLTFKTAKKLILNSHPYLKKLFLVVWKCSIFLNIISKLLDALLVVTITSLSMKFFQVTFSIWVTQYWFGLFRF